MVIFHVALCHRLSRLTSLHLSPFACYSLFLIKITSGLTSSMFFFLEWEMILSFSWALTHHPSCHLCRPTCISTEPRSCIGSHTTARLITPHSIQTYASCQVRKKRIIPMLILTRLPEELTPKLTMKIRSKHSRRKHRIHNGKDAQIHRKLDK